MKVSDIFLQKLNEIQSRLPIRISSFTNHTSFEQYLENAVNPASGEKSKAVSNINEHQERLKTLKSSYERARISRMTSTAYIPKDMDKLMEIVNRNISAASSKYGVDSSLIKAVIKQESNFDPYALSYAGAQGLMQLMPETASLLGLSDPWDIAQNIDGGTRYLRDQIIAFEGDIKLALAAYNAGPNNVRKYGGIPPFAETQSYVENILEHLNEV